jgi:hypothetical protein
VPTASQTPPPTPEGLRGGYTTVWSRRFSPADVARICAERFATGDKRSEPYRLGFKYCMNNRLLGDTLPLNLYAEGSAEWDAYYAGLGEAREHAEHAKAGVKP